MPARSSRTQSGSLPDATREGREGVGRLRLLSPLDLPDGTHHLAEILDQAGGFLIDLGRDGDGDGLELVNDLGWSLHEAGSFDEALTCLDTAVPMDPADPL